MTQAYETLIARIQAGDASAQNDLFEAVYDLLRGIALNQMRNERPGQTLQPTALVNEAYLKLAGSEGQSWDNVGHFVGAASRAMRQILIDRARKHNTAKHGGDRQRVPIENCERAQSAGTWHELIWLDQALDALAREDATLASLVEMKYFLGLSIPAIAQAQGVAERTVNNRWKFARVWLKKQICEQAD